MRYSVLAFSFQNRRPEEPEYRLGDGEYAENRKELLKNLGKLIKTTPDGASFYEYEQVRPRWLQGLAFPEEHPLFNFTMLSMIMEEIYFPGTSNKIWYLRKPLIEGLTQALIATYKKIRDK